MRRQGFGVLVLALEAGPGATVIPRPLAGKILKKLGGDAEGYWRKVGAGLAEAGCLGGVEHVHAGWANELTWIAWAAAETKGLPWSFSGHARDLWVEGGDLQAKLAAAKFASACTRAGTERLRGAGSPEKVLYAPHGLELRKFPWRDWEPGSSVELLGVGRLVEKKGWNLALQVLPLLASGMDVRLSLIGEGPERTKLEKQAKALKMLDRVNFAGALTEKEVIAAMRRADCLVLPSLVAADGDKDGLANVLLEGAACGIPLVTTDAGSAGDFVDESTGVLVTADDPGELLRGIASVFGEPEVTRARCGEARRRVEVEFDLEPNVARLAERFRT